MRPARALAPLAIAAATLGAASAMAGGMTVLTPAEMKEQDARDLANTESLLAEVAQQLAVPRSHVELVDMKRVRLMRDELDVRVRLRENGIILCRKSYAEIATFPIVCEQSRSPN